MTTSSVTRAPDAMRSLAFLPTSVPAATAALSMSPVDSWGVPHLSTIFGACVPLPAFLRVRRPRGGELARRHCLGILLHAAPPSDTHAHTSARGTKEDHDRAFLLAKRPPRAFGRRSCRRKLRLREGLAILCGIGSREHTALRVSHGTIRLQADMTSAQHIYAQSRRLCTHPRPGWRAAADASHPHAHSRLGIARTARSDACTRRAAETGTSSQNAPEVM